MSKFDEVIGHTAFINFSGYAKHARNFFTYLNKLTPVRVRNFAHTPTLDHLTQEQKDILIYQDWSHSPWKVGRPWTKQPGKNYFNIILMESHHYYFYDEYVRPKIAYNVWESTRQMEEFFNRILTFDQLWVPTEWQKQCSIEQGYPEDRIRVVPEGVDGNVFYPKEVDAVPPEYLNGNFKFIVFGRWDYRKSIEEIIRAFINEFRKEEPVDLILSVDNPFPLDGLNTTDERLSSCDLRDPRIQLLHFPPDDEYIKYLRTGHCYVSCSRAEGWNLPLIEAIACGIPTISSNYGAQLEFAAGHSHMVDIKKMKSAQHVFNIPDCPGEYAEPDFEHLQAVMRDVYENYDEYKKGALVSSQIVRKEFAWDNAAKKAYDIIEEFDITHDDVKPVSESEMFRIVQVSREKNRVEFSYRGPEPETFRTTIYDLDTNLPAFSNIWTLTPGENYWMSPANCRFLRG